MPWAQKLSLCRRGAGRGLPLSILLSGRPFAEATVLRVAHAYQGATAWHTCHPAL